ncbi:MAG: hypothetical protein Q4D42_12335 [Eubacteriales bacterium]|nr:hypothetical protein [Eubacteriales bacterium]
MKKKIFTLAVASILLLAALVGCGSSQGSTNEDRKTIFEMSTTEVVTAVVESAGKNIDNLPDIETDTSDSSVTSSLDVSEGIQLVVIAHSGEISSLNVVMDASDSNSDTEIFSEYSDAIMKVVGSDSKAEDMTVNEWVEEDNARYGIYSSGFEIQFNYEFIQ